MTVWILYLLIEGHSIDYPYHFAFKDTCGQVGQSMVKEYKYESYRCVQERME